MEMGRVSRAGGAGKVSNASSWDDNPGRLRDSANMWRLVAVPSLEVSHEGNFWGELERGFISAGLEDHQSDLGVRGDCSPLVCPSKLTHFYF